MPIAVLLAQFPVSLSIQSNIETMRAVLEQTRTGDLVVFPEGSISGYSTDVSFLERIQHQELRAGLSLLQTEAKRREITIWSGAYIKDDSRWYNAAYGFTPGSKTYIYHKINLATHERGIFLAGIDLPVFELDTPTGAVVVGIQMCRELRFPEQWRSLSRRGAQVILHLNNAIGDDRYQSVWRSHLISRAAETQRFVISVNNADPKQICPTMAIAPDGQVMEEIVSNRLKLLRVELDLSKVSNWYLDQSRIDIIAIN